MTEKETLYFEIFNKVLELTDDGFIVTDIDGIILDINEKYCKFLKTTKKEAVGKSIFKFIPNSKMLDIVENRYTEESVIHTYEEGTTEETKVIVSRSYVEDDNNNVVAGVAQVKFRLDSLDAAKKLMEQYSTLNYYKEQYQALQENAYEFDHLIGEDPVFEVQKRRASHISKTHFSVLLTGETGTGKEVFAKAIHNSSDRKDYPMISINCAAIPNELLESELFGYEEGAFTGAKKGGKKGKFEIANHGTLFLDEIGDMPLSMQAKLLRVLEEKKVDPIGSTSSIPIDIRLICATRKNLHEMVLNGTFREDLFYRINVINLEMIPLRNRRNDINLLAKYFLECLNEEYRKEIDFSEEVKICLYSYNWPGNVRELDNIIKSAYAVCDGLQIRLKDLPSRLVRDKQSDVNQLEKEMNYHKAMEKFEEQLIRNYLLQSRGNVQKAADLAKIHRSLLYKKLQKYNISIYEYRKR